MAVELTTAPSAVGTALAVQVVRRMVVEVTVTVKTGGVVVSGIWLVESCSPVSTFDQPRRHEFRRGKLEPCGKQH
jgi:hypothetical protein